MPDPQQHPEYGTNLRGLLPPVNTDELRKTVEREVRRTLNELVPGVNPGIIFDVLVDVTVNQATQAQTQVEVTMSAMQHTVSYSATHASQEPNWAAPPFRTEYAAEFQQTHDDMVDSMRYAMGVNRGSPDQTAVTYSSRDAAMTQAFFQQDRFDELRNNFEALRPNRPKPNPIIEAVIRAKLEAPKVRPAPPPPPAKQMSVWEHLRANYALFG